MSGIFIPGLERGFVFKTSRSSGAGGQHVNKVETRVELHFDVVNSQLLSDEQKEKVLEGLKNRISKKGVLILSSGSERSQLANKRKVKERFYELLEDCLKEEKKRVPTKPSKAVKEKRLQAKKQQAEKKQRRSKDCSGKR